MWRKSSNFGVTVGKRRRKFRLSLALASILIFGITFVTQSIIRTFAATNNATTSVAMDEKGEHFEIMYYWGPSGEQINANPSAVLSKIVNAGFTIAPIRGTWSSQWTYTSLPSAIASLDSYKLKTYVFEGSNVDIGTATDKTSFFNTNIKPYTNFKNVIGYDITDEPPINSTSGVSVGLDVVNPAVTALYSIDPMRDSYVNLFPNYAPSSCLQYKTATGCDGQGSINLDQYESYLSTYFNNSAVRTLSVDYYSKSKTDLTDTYSGYSDRDLFYANLRSLLNNYKAKRNNNVATVPMNIATLQDWYINAENKANVSFQISMNLAFGMKRISYFTYKKPDDTGTVGWSSGWMTDTSAINTTTQYNQISDINSWAFKLGNELYTKEVGAIDQVYGSNNANMYRDDNIIYNTGYLGTVTAVRSSGGQAAQAVVTSFDDASFYIVNGEPNQEIKVTWTGGVRISDAVIFNARTGSWGSCATDLCSVSGETITLPAGGNILFHLGSGISNTTSVVVDREDKNIVLYSDQLSDVVNEITSSTKTLSGSTLTLSDGTYNVLYPSSTKCTIRPAFLWTGFGNSYTACNITTNSSAISVRQVDNNYIYIKYNRNGRQVKNLPIISGTIKSGSNYIVTGDTIKTNGASFDQSNITITNGIAEQSGNTLNIYTWPKKILVASYVIDSSSQTADHAYFTNITLTSGTLNPSFSPPQTAYTVEASSCTNAFTVTGVGNSTYGVTNKSVTKAITAGTQTPFNLVAEDSNHYQRSYTVNVTCTETPAPVDHAYFIAVALSDGTINFSPTTTTYSISVDHDVSSITISATGDPAYGVESKIVTENLTPGVTKTITLTAVDSNNFSRIYYFHVTRDNPPDEDHAYFTNIALSDGTINFSPTTTTYAVTVPNSVSSMTVTGIGNSTYGVSNQTVTKNLTVGVAVAFTLTATDSGNHSRTYTVNVTREAPPVDHAYFTNITVTPPPEDVFTFNPSITDYSISYPYSVESVTITATGDSAYGVASKTVTQALTAGAITDVAVTATDSNGYSRPYIFHITRASAPVDHAYFTNITLSSGTLNFSPTTTIYNVRVANSVSSMTITGIGDSAYGVENKTLTKALTAGDITTFVLTATDSNNFSRDYTIKVYREGSTPTVDHAYFTNITLSSGTINFSPTTTSYNITVDYSVDSLTVTGIGDSTYGVSNQTLTKSLVAGGVTDFVLTATDSNNYTRDYTVYVTRSTASATATLSSITVTYDLNGSSHTATLSPTFSSSVYNYNAVVPNAATNIAYNYTVGESTSNAVGTPLGYVSTTGTTVTITVTAQDSTTTNVYHLTITRQTSSNANLASLILKNPAGTTFAYTPAFSANTLSYSATVPNYETDVTPHYTLEDTAGANATITSTVVDSLTTRYTINVVAEDGTSKSYTVTITRKEIEISTVAKSKRTSNNKELAAGQVIVTDTVKLVGLKQGTSYKLKGTLKDSSGNTIETQTDSFTMTAASGSDFSVVMEISFDSSAYIGRNVVVFEELQDSAGNVLAKHESLDDANQTVSVLTPTISTVAVNNRDGSSKELEVGEQSVKDTVSFAGLVSGGTYRLEGKLVRKDTGAEVATKSTSFTASGETGTASTVFTLNTIEHISKDLVVYEYLYYGENKIAEHVNLNDDNQTVRVKAPTLATTASDNADGDKLIEVDEGIKIKDRVTYDGLASGSSYSLVMKVVKRSDPSAVVATGSLDFTASAVSGSVDVVSAAFDSTPLHDSNFNGLDLVVYDYLYYNSTQIAKHESTNDTAQIITVKTPTITTTSYDTQNRSRNLPIGTTAIVDEVAFTNLVPGKSYVLSGILMDKTTGSAAKDNSGNDIAGSLTFTPSSASGTVDVTFSNFDSTLFYDYEATNQLTFVAFEKLYKSGTEIARHEDINDTNQSITTARPNLVTRATNKLDGSNRLGVGDVTIKDYVDYSGLVEGEWYTVEGKVFDPETNHILEIDNEYVVVSKSFKAGDHGTGTVDVEINLNTTNLRGKKFIVHERLYRNADKHGDGRLLAVHEEALDEGTQTISVKNVEIITEAKDKADGDNVIAHEPNQTISDTVQYDGLLMNETYTLYGYLYNKTTGEKLLNNNGEAISASKTFRAPTDRESGSVVLDYTLDASSLPGVDIVVYEYLYSGNIVDESNLVVKHDDPDDLNQTVRVAMRVGTAAVDSSDGDQTLGVGFASITDNVHYEGLELGSTYRAKGYLVNESGNPILDNEGHEIASEKTFEVGSSEYPNEDGYVKIEFDINTRQLAGQKIIVFEELYRIPGERAIELVAEHKDLIDTNQTLNVARATVHAELTDNSDGDKIITNSGHVTVSAKIYYSNLVPGTPYAINTKLIFKDSGVNVALDGGATGATIELTPTRSTGSEVIEFSFNTDTSMSGKEIVVFSTLYMDETPINADSRRGAGSDDDTSNHLFEIANERDVNIIDATVKVYSNNPNTGAFARMLDGAKQEAPFIILGIVVIAIGTFSFKKRKNKTYGHITFD